MKSIFVAALMLVFGPVAGAVGPEECQEKFNSDIRAFYESQPRQARALVSFNVGKPSIVRYPESNTERQADASAEPASDAPVVPSAESPAGSPAEPPAHTRNSDDGAIVTTHAYAKYKRAPHLEVSIQYQVNGNECVEVPNSRQIVNTYEIPQNK